MAKAGRKEHSLALYETILKLKDLDECCRFFEDLCTPTELQAMEQRFDVAVYLQQGLVYLDILEKKSQRLKTLTEDVVEASKISSGNIKLEFMNINLVEMVLQTNGEFSEKFENRNLKVILNLPEEPVYIYADGRRMWRVLENLFNNAAKYAMEGTRIYADIKADNLKVEFSLKNISEQPLNISADELTERFIRGDVSRSTEGSGLGLSIAKSLVERQRGKLDLYLDGDLFKATVTFDRVYSK